MKIEECKQHFAKNVKILRNTHGFTMEQMAEVCGVSRMAVHNWENRGVLPKLERLIAIGEVFSVDPFEILVRDFSIRFEHE